MICHQSTKLFNFTSLHHWAQIEIWRQAKDLTSAIIPAKALVDLRASPEMQGEKLKSRPKEKKPVKKRA